MLPRNLCTLPIEALEKALSIFNELPNRLQFSLITLLALNFITEAHAYVEPENIYFNDANRTSTYDLQVFDENQKGYSDIFTDIVNQCNAKTANASSPDNFEVISDLYPPSTFGRDPDGFELLRMIGNQTLISFEDCVNECIKNYVATIKINEPLLYGLIAIFGGFFLCIAGIYLKFQCREYCNKNYNTISDISSQEDGPSLEDGPIEDDLKQEMTVIGSPSRSNHSQLLTWMRTPQNGSIDNDELQLDDEADNRPEISRPHSAPPSI